MTKLPGNKTKIVCTIGPASGSPEVMERMLAAGMNIARINFSHGTFDEHRRVITDLRAAAEKSARRLVIMADLPGPKMRIGHFAAEPVELRAGDPFTVTAEDVAGDASRVSVSFTTLPDVVKPGDRLFLNDGFIQLEVVGVEARDVRCRVLVGGELRSRKGLNLPGIDLGITAFTDRDRECLAFALENGVDAVSQSFVESGDDVKAVREAAAALGKHPFIIAKIERSRALQNIDGILEAADGIMVARGDLGVELPIETIAVVQKQLLRKANALGKPVITATQMLESMTGNRRPTRAESTDVANAILDGTDCVMLSEESAMGQYPVDAVAMLAGIAAATEPSHPRRFAREAFMEIAGGAPVSRWELISMAVGGAMERLNLAGVVIPSRSGDTVRRFARLRLPVWIAAASTSATTCQGLQFSYGVYPIHTPREPQDWSAWSRAWTKGRAAGGEAVILIGGPSETNPRANHRMEIIDLA